MAGRAGSRRTARRGGGRGKNGKSSMLGKLRELRGMVPGCRAADDTVSLLRKTADYIARLELQVSALKQVAGLYGV